MVSVKFSSVICKIIPSNTSEPSHSTFDAQSLLFGVPSRHDCGNTIKFFCPLNDSSSTQVHHSAKKFKITMKSVLGHMRVTSLKWVYTADNQLLCVLKRDKTTYPSGFAYVHQDSYMYIKIRTYTSRFA